ncbi:MAG: GntR family transcriptional regulator [Desulfobacteraceae bacterium]|jgi:DNA-binding GntR family transcriptional regulator|nr:GntR family transcriptional regulator [Desulfobacteraceae bacterium]
MELIEVDTRHAYTVIREKIVTLALKPGALINEQELAEEIETGVFPVREALKLLTHDGLVFITPRHGLYVADISLPDLEQLSEMRLALEPVCARLAAERADRDDLAVLEALRKEQLATDPQDSKRLLDIDHKFHQALIRAARNKYLARSLEHLFGLSQRLWFLTLPKLDFLHGAVAEHLEMLEAVRDGDADRAERIMRGHVGAFYDRVRSLLRSED